MKRHNPFRKIENLHEHELRKPYAARRRPAPPRLQMNICGGSCNRPLVADLHVDLQPCGCLLCCPCWIAVLSHGAPLVCPKCAGHVDVVRIKSWNQPHQELEMVVIPTAKGEQLSFSHRRRQAPPPQQQAAGEKAETKGEDEPPRGSSGAGHRAGAPYSRGGATKKSPRLTRALSTRGLTTLANERRALSLLYARLGGDGWTRHDNWLSDEPLSEWQGVQCDSKTGRVRRLYLSHIGLVGMLYDGILAPCQQLRILDLSHNPDIDGALPASLMAMKRLTLVDVSHTGLDFVPPNMYETGAKVVAPFEIFLEGHTADDVSAQPTHCTYRCTHKACVH